MASSPWTSGKPPSTNPLRAWYEHATIAFTAHTHFSPQLGLLNAIQNIGCLAAYPFSPYLADGYGRRTAVAFGAFIMCAATVLQTASKSVGMFIGARYVICGR